MLAAGIARARALATVLPNDSANVFITLSARSLNSTIEIIARGDAVSTERKLIHAGADKVVLPTHIGAERIAEILLFPETSRFIRESERMRELEKQLRNLGLVIEVVVAPENGALTGLTVEEIEFRTYSAFFIVQINRRDGEFDHQSQQADAHRSRRRRGGRRAQRTGRQCPVRRAQTERTLRTIAIVVALPVPYRSLWPDLSRP